MTARSPVPGTARALAVRGLADVCPETLAVCVRRAVGTLAEADVLGALLLLADDAVWEVQVEAAFVTDAARRAEALARLRARALDAGLPAREHRLNVAVELSVAALKAARRMPPNAGAG